MSVKVIEFSMTDFFNKMEEKYGKIEVDLKLGFDSFFCDERDKEKYCFWCNNIFSSIICDKRRVTNDKGIVLETENVLVNFDWSQSDENDEKISKEIEDVLEQTLNLRFILSTNEVGYTLKEIACIEDELYSYPDKKNPNDKDFSLYAIYYKED